MRIPIRIINVASVESDPTKLQMVFFRPDEFIAVPASKSGFAFLDIDNVFHGDVEITAPGRLRLHDSFDVTLASTGHSFQIGADNNLNLAADANEIQARNNGAASTLFLNDLGGSITMITSGTGTAQFGAGAMVRLLNTTDVTLASTGHPFQIGPTSGINLRIDNDEIQAVNDGAASDLYLNWAGGGIRLGTNTADVYVSGRLRLSNTTDASLASTGHAFQTGDDASTNIIIDNNEIIARNNGAASSLFINGGSGPVVISSGSLQFPATQIASADVNTMDDYLEDTFTPAIAGTTTAGVGTYTTQSAYALKLGRHVFVTISMTWTAHTGTGNMIVTGLPYAGVTHNAVLNMELTNAPITAGSIPSAVTSGSTVLLRQTTAAGVTSSIPIDTAATIRVSGWYLVAN